MAAMVGLTYIIFRNIAEDPCGRHSPDEKTVVRIPTPYRAPRHFLISVSLFLLPISCELPAAFRTSLVG